MKIETIYNDLVEIMKNDMDFQKALKLKEKLEQVIREENCFKTSNKTRISAIKKVASKREDRPALTGYGICGDYKVVTDTYHLVAIKEENMPLKLATTDKELADKVGHENCINGNYVNAEPLLKYNTDTEITLDLDDIVSFYKMHHKRASKELYDLKEYGLYNIDYLKNIIDILGKDIKVYYQGEYKPLYIVNENNEIGLVLPCRKY